MGIRGPRLTYANVMSTLAVCLALGGGIAWAASVGPNSVGSKQLQQAAVKTQDLADGAVESEKIAKQAVKTKQLAEDAVKAQQLAKQAVQTKHLEERAVGTAQIALGAIRENELAIDAVALKHMQASLVAGLRDGCPAGTIRFSNAVCVEAAARPNATYYDALTTCASAGMRLPTQGEAWMARGFIGAAGDGFWTELSFREGASDGRVNVAVVLQRMNDQSVRYRIHDVNVATSPFRCATPPSEG